MKRQRGRGRKSNGGGHQNRNYESSGPDVKIRGSASHVYEKYQQLARDAASAGDRIAAESYLQHAEHYFRLLRAQQQHQRDREEASRESAPQQGADRDDGDASTHAEGVSSQPSGPLDVVDPEAAERDSGSDGARDEREDGRPRRTRRPRRPRAAEEPRAASDEPLEAAGDASALDAS